jgi:hypothetical protein
VASSARLYIDRDRDGEVQGDAMRRAAMFSRVAIRFDGKWSQPGGQE